MANTGISSEIKNITTQMKIKYILSAVILLVITGIGIVSYAYYIVIHPQIELEETAYIYIYTPMTPKSLL